MLLPPLALIIVETEEDQRALRYQIDGQKYKRDLLSIIEPIVNAIGANESKESLMEKFGVATNRTKHKHQKLNMIILVLHIGFI
jgi:hypothetical protein